ncbi:ABC transporter substrate-binding protein [Bengtsoniella intestinalis]|uniref:ABC transporter substrate-binding protein n=1 Tax=Bengtsoniella intestinalis TaxID=3073143 RepID=UPI00391F5946
MKNLKKLFSAALALTMALSLAACSSSDDTATTTTETTTAAQEETEATKSYKIAIVKQLDHASMDEIANAVAAELDASDLNVTYEHFSGQNDTSVLQQIGAQLIADGYNAIIPIGTLAAQAMAVAAEDTQTPVVYGAVSDPESAGLTGISYMTGTSDALNTEFMMDMMLAANPNIETVGLLYSTSEVNSAVPIAQAKAYLDAAGIAYIEKTGNTNDEVIAAVNSMLDQVQAVFTPTDNVVMAVELTIGETMADAGIAHYGGADSFVRNGAFATAGVNYEELGAKSAEMALDILTTGEVPDFHVMDGGIITVNTETAATLGLDYSVFSDMAGTVVEVVTTVD